MGDNRPSVRGGGGASQRSLHVAPPAAHQQASAARSASSSTNGTGKSLIRRRAAAAAAAGSANLEDLKLLRLRRDIAHGGGGGGEHEIPPASATCGISPKLACTYARSTIYREIQPQQPSSSHRNAGGPKIGKPICNRDQHRGGGSGPHVQQIQSFSRAMPGTPKPTIPSQRQHAVHACSSSRDMIRQLVPTTRATPWRLASSRLSTWALPSAVQHSPPGNLGSGPPLVRVPTLANDLVGGSGDLEQWALCCFTKEALRIGLPAGRSGQTPLLQKKGLGAQS